MGNTYPLTLATSLRVLNRLFKKSDCVDIFRWLMYQQVFYPGIF